MPCEISGQRRVHRLTAFGRRPLPAESRALSAPLPRLHAGLRAGAIIAAAAGLLALECLAPIRPVRAAPMALDDMAALSKLLERVRLTAGIRNTETSILLSSDR